MLYSTLPNLPPFRSHCVGGWWDWAQDCCIITHNIYLIFSILISVYLLLTENHPPPPPPPSPAFLTYLLEIKHTQIFTWACGPWSWGGILGYQFNKRFESFAPCYSQSLLLANFTETHTVSGFKKSLQKIIETRKLEPLHEQHFVERKNEGGNPNKNLSLRRLEFMPRNLE
jgi:hypothetical protein